MPKPSEKRRKCDVMVDDTESDSDDGMTIVRKKPLKKVTKRAVVKRSESIKRKVVSISSDEDSDDCLIHRKSIKTSTGKRPNALSKLNRIPSSESEFGRNFVSDDDISDSDTNLSFVVTDSSLSESSVSVSSEDATFTKPSKTPKSRTKPKQAPKSTKVKVSKSPGKKFSTLSAELTAILGPRSESVTAGRLQGKLTRELFVFFNDKIFGGALPKSTGISWNSRMISAAGRCEYGKRNSIKIQLSPKIIKTDKYKLRDILLHEMVHGVTYLKDKKETGHGKLFYSYADIIERKLPKIPRVTRCHNYKIDYKFIYYCVDCGESYGRQRRTIDVKIDSCGTCRGKLKFKMGKRS